ncbi:MAG: class I SAM-dependent methyltransferase, partial [Candidatus Cloacimonadaceae bacterium]|nr:class I SAM-dependent methyltransferase [Candidatus Cloacimonadaceae bacterium]
HPGWDDADVIEQSIKDLDSMLALLKIRADGKVLDLGCGAGNLSFWLEEKGLQVSGCDISETAIEWAKEAAQDRGSSVAFRVEDATRALTYASDSFDLVVDNHCLHCIIGDDREQYLKEVERILKPGAFYLLSTMCSDSLHPIGIEGFDGQSRCIIKRGIAIRYIGMPQHIIMEFNRRGLDIIHQETRGCDSDSKDLFVIAMANKRKPPLFWECPNPPSPVGSRNTILVSTPGKV